MLRILPKIAALCLGLSACSTFPAAEMRLPAPLSASPDRFALGGIGGGDKGRFAFAGYAGSYDRANWQLDWGGDINRRGRVAFDLSGPEISDNITADCRMRERVLDFGIVEVTAGRLAYRCEFLANGRAFPARFELQEVKTKVINRYERRGEIALGGEVLQIRSVHNLAGTPLPTAAPIGYLFEQRGAVLGAVQLNGTPRVSVAAGADPGARRTMVIAALALALLRDPADS